MLEILHLLATFVDNLFRSRRRLEIENLFLRHQLNIAVRRAPRRLQLHGSDRALLVWITWIWPNLLDLSQVVKPRRRSFAGIALGSKLSGAGNPDIGQVGRRSIANYAISSGG